MFAQELVHEFAQELVHELALEWVLMFAQEWVPMFAQEWVHELAHESCVLLSIHEYVNEWDAVNELDWEWHVVH